MMRTLVLALSALLPALAVAGVTRVEILADKTPINIVGHAQENIVARGSLSRNPEGTVATLRIPNSRSPVDVVIPRDAMLYVESVGGTVSVRDMSAAVTVQTDHARVTVSGVRGAVDVRTFDQPILIRDVDGNVRAESLHHKITLERIRGQIVARSVTHGINVRDCQADLLEMTSTTGILDYVGAIGADAQYTMTTHTGVLKLKLRPDSDATLTVGGNLRALTVRGAPVQTDNDVAVVTVGKGRGRVQASAIVGAMMIAVDKP